MRRATDPLSSLGVLWQAGVSQPRLAYGLAIGDAECPSVFNDIYLPIVRAVRLPNHTRFSSCTSSSSLCQTRRGFEQCKGWSSRFGLKPSVLDCVFACGWVWHLLVLAQTRHACLSCVHARASRILPSATTDSSEEACCNHTQPSKLTDCTQPSKLT